MTGTKFGCGLERGGARAIHLDGKPVRSCIKPISAIIGKRVTTIAIEVYIVPNAEPPGGMITSASHGTEEENLVLENTSRQLGRHGL